MITLIGFGGGCHWCTEAVFASLKGVAEVQQGWIKPTGDGGYSEAVIVRFDPDHIPLEVLVKVHLHTHSATSRHSMRGKYRSAIYTFSDADKAAAIAAIKKWQPEFAAPIVTEVFSYEAFRLNRSEQLNYYYSDPERPFCQTYINPKLKLLLTQFEDVADSDKLAKLKQ